jgi:hypothetical protein
MPLSQNISRSDPSQIYSKHKASMKNSPKATGPKTSTNPTTAKGTMYRYVCISLVALIHMLHDYLHHIRNRETQRRGSASDMERDQYSRPSYAKPSRSSRSPPPAKRYGESDGGYRTEERRPRRSPTPPSPSHRTGTKTTSRSRRPSTHLLRIAAIPTPNQKHPTVEPLLLLSTAT